MKHVCPFTSSAHASTATATASECFYLRSIAQRRLFFLIFAEVFRARRPNAALASWTAIEVLQRPHCLAGNRSGAAQAAQFVRIILAYE